MSSILNTNAQVAFPFFDLTIDQDVYTPLEGAQSLNQGIPYDDPEYDCPIGFSFSYLGEVYDSLVFGGIDSYGMECVFWEDFPPTPRSIISPSMHDIIDGQFDVDGKADSDIRYLVEGNPGERIFKLEWSNVGFYNEDAPYSMRINNQMWLYEADNSIEFRYGPQTELNYDIILDYFGVPIAFTKNIDFNEFTWVECQALTGDPQNPEFISLADYGAFEVADFLTAAPAEGVVYRFAPLTVNVQEKQSNALKVYPNPASESIRVDVSTDFQQPRYVIYDHSGRQVLQGGLNENSRLIDVSILSPGVYQLMVTDNQKADVTKLMIK